MSALQHITEKDIATLRAAVATRMSAYRYRHTLAVEEEAVALAKIYLPKNMMEISAAALLHDLTKEWTYEEQISFSTTEGIALTADERLSPKVLHAKTAPRVIEREFPQFASKKILNAVRCHTVGARRMSLFAKLLYLADYIEKTRTFADCVALRSLFWDGIEKLPRREQRRHLDRVILTSYDMTLRSLLEEGAPISPITVDARNALLSKNLHS